MKIPGIVIVLFTIVFVLIGINLENIICFVKYNFFEFIILLIFGLFGNFLLLMPEYLEFKKGKYTGSKNKSFFNYTPLGLIFQLAYWIYIILKNIVQFINKHLTITI